MVLLPSLFTRKTSTLPTILSRGMNFPTMWYFDMNRLEPVQPPFKLRNSKNHHRIFKRLAKVSIGSIRLCAFAGWSEPLLVEYTTLLQISCRGSFLT